ncbi:hypothetical protein [Cupriavidus sp. H39]
MFSGGGASVTIDKQQINQFERKNSATFNAAALIWITLLMDHRYAV